MADKFCKIAVYTAIIDGYDDIPVVLHKEDHIDYICFSDMDLASNGIWEIRKIERRFADPQRDSRRIKLLPHHFLPKYDLSLWIDANIRLTKYSPTQIIEHIGPNVIANLKHMERDCAYDEAKAVLEYGVDDADIIKRQMHKYKMLGFPEHFGLGANCFQIRRHSHPRCKIFCELWWNELSQNSRRDQLSFDFVRWLTREKMATLPINYLENDIFKWGPKRQGGHSSDRMKYKKFWSVPSAPFKPETAPPCAQQEIGQLTDAPQHSHKALTDSAIARMQASGFSISRAARKIVIRNTQVTICGESDNTIWTTCNIFCEESYAFRSCDDFVVFDIGLNIGAASLYYAQYKNIKKIYAFEPFLPTYNQAMINFELNKNLSTKIDSYNFGLGLKNKITAIHYNRLLPGSMSSVIDRFNNSSDIQSIEIKNASEVLGPLFAKHTEKILLKIDCEGAEKEILSALSKNNLLRKVNSIVLEWHFTPPAYLNKLLVKNGFFLFYNHTIPNNLGMLYAFREHP
jgi:FkbM family methyltransferase